MAWEEFPHSLDPKQTSQFAGTWSSRPSGRSQVNDHSCESAVTPLARDPMNDPGAFLSHLTNVLMVTVRLSLI
jgi:hypothetical protein